MRLELFARTQRPHVVRAENLQATVYRRGEGNSYRPIGCGERLQASEPFAVDIELAELLPRWAR